MLENAFMSRFLLPVSGLWSYPFGIERREGRNCFLQRAELGSPKSLSLIQVNTLGREGPPTGKEVAVKEKLAFSRRPVRIGGVIFFLGQHHTEGFAPPHPTQRPEVRVAVAGCRHVPRLNRWTHPQV